MFQKQDICWVCLASVLMIGGYSLIWSSEPEIRSFRLRYEVTVEQKSPNSGPEAIENAITQTPLELAQTTHDSQTQD